MLGLTTTDDARDLTDEEVLARSHAEPWLFAVLLERYQDAFLRKAQSIIFNALDAEEVVQDAFTKMYMHAHRFELREGAKFSSWAYTILINTALTRYQKCVREGKRTYNLDPELEQRLGDMKGGDTFNERQDAIARILDLLPEHFAYVLRLHYLERWSHKDIAAETGESVGAVKARIHRAKAQFRKESEVHAPDILKDI
ncbi:MAG: RNA polymerase sigma factor [Candidatus Pacebacteria bacterium]|nr:RNA polymerase sigma factor [Candidatus Paceibacterota bacterium]